MRLKFKAGPGDDPYDRVIYNKKYIFGLHAVSGTELLKLLKFPKQQSEIGVLWLK